MDAILCLEAEIRKAQTNKEMVVAVFFDIEKAYDMLWKEGLLMKFEKLGIGGKLYNWVLDFLFGRKIEVRVGTAYSDMHAVENGTPQGSVCSPVLFNIMINDIFDQIDRSVGRSLYADDGALWVRGRNLKYLEKKMQDAIVVVEEWANKWGFRMSVAKTQVICFSRRHKDITLKLYEQKLEQVSSVRFLGVLFDERLTWKQHIEYVQNKCKKVNNLLRCISGQDWGAERGALLRVYQALMRSSLDYGCLAYMGAAESHLIKLDRAQSQGLRICCGALRSSPVAALQVEAGELPIRLRRIKLMHAYWVNLQGHGSDHPAKTVLQECCEHQESVYNSFGWIGNIKAQNLGLTQFRFSPTVSCSRLPPWLFVMPVVDLHLQLALKKKKSTPEWLVVQNYFVQFEEHVVLYTDGSKDPSSGRTGAAVSIPQYKIQIKRRTSDHLAVYTVELLAIALALNWLLVNCAVGITKAVIASDSQAALLSIQTGKSCRLDLLYRIHDILFQLHSRDVCVQFVWVPAHVGVDGNEEADILAKQAMKSVIVNIAVPLSKNEAKSIIRDKVIGMWQEQWDDGDTGRHLYNIQQLVGGSRSWNGSRRVGAVMTRLRIGHSGLNKSLFKIGKHPTGACEFCGEPETTHHVLLECDRYDEERRRLTSVLSKEAKPLTIGNLLGNVSKNVQYQLIMFLKNTRLINRI